MAVNSPKPMALTDLVSDGHCQLVGFKPHWRAMRTACSCLRCRDDAGDLGPNLHGLGPDGLIPSGWNFVATKVKKVINPVMGEEEALCLGEHARSWEAGAAG